jgi:uncharacterized membrane protein
MAAIFVGGILVYTLYLYPGPYEKLSQQNRRLKAPL